MVDTVIIDWKAITNLEEFFSVLFSQISAPDWHGRSLDALYDSLVVGCINEIGPPYKFICKNTSEVQENLIDFQTAIIGIFVDSVRQHADGEVIVR